MSKNLVSVTNVGGKTVTLICSKSGEKTRVGPYSTRKVEDRFLGNQPGTIVLTEKLNKKVKPKQEPETVPEPVPAEPVPAEPVPAEPENQADEEVEKTDEPAEPEDEQPEGDDNN